MKLNRLQAALIAINLLACTTSIYDTKDKHCAPKECLLNGSITECIKTISNAKKNKITHATIIIKNKDDTFYLKLSSKNKNESTHTTIKTTSPEIEIISLITNDKFYDITIRDPKKNKKFHKKGSITSLHGSLLNKINTTIIDIRNKKDSSYSIKHKKESLYPIKIIIHEKGEKTQSIILSKYKCNPNTNTQIPQRIVHTNIKLKTSTHLYIDPLRPPMLKKINMPQDTPSNTAPLSDGALTDLLTQFGLHTAP